LQVLTKSTKNNCDGDAENEIGLSKRKKFVNNKRKAVKNC